MAKEEPTPRERLREVIAAHQARMLARCFGAGEGASADPQLAEHYAALIAEIASLPREHLLALRLLSPLTKEGGPAADREGEELVTFRRLADASDSGFAVTDLRGTLTYANPALCRMLEAARPEELFGRSLIDFYPAELRESYVGHIMPTVLDKGQWSGELPMRAPSGRTTPTIQNIFVVRGEGSSPPYLANLILDNSQRKRAEDALRASEERFRGIFENSTIGIYRTTPAGRILIANPALVRMLGYNSFAELVELNLEDGGYAPQYPREEFRRLMERDGEVRGHEATWLRRDGQPLHVRESAIAVRGPAGEITYYEGTVEDVSETHRAHEALRTSEENFRAVAENAQEAILIAVADGTHVFANRRAAEISGYRIEELLRTSVRDLAHPHELPQIAEDFRRRMAGESVPRYYETRIVAKDGRHIPIELSAARTTWQGQPATMVLFRDITNRKLAEQALRESQEKFRNLVEEIDEIIYEFDAEGRFAYVSPAIRHFGYEPQELIGRTFIDLVPEEDLPQARRLFAKLIAGEGRLQAEGRLVTKRGGMRWCRHHSRPISTGDSGVKFAGMRGVIVDITEVKLAEQALRESEEKYRALVEEIGEIIYEVDSKCLVTYVSPAVERVLGYRPDEIVGHALTEFAAPEEQPWAQELVDNFGAERLELQGERCVRTKSGEERWIQHFSRPIEKDGVFAGARGVIIDVTDLRAARQALKESEQKYAAMVEHAMDGVVIFQDERICFANQTISRVTGYTSDELVGMHFIDVVAPDSRAIAAERYQRRLAGEDEPSFYKLNILCKDGSIREVEMAVSIIQYRGRPATMAVARETALREEGDDRPDDALYPSAELLGHSPDGLLIVKGGLVMLANRALLALLDRSPAEVIGAPLRDLVPPEHHDALAAHDPQHPSQDWDPRHYELQLCRRDGAPVAVDVTEAQIRSGDQPAVVVVVRPTSGGADEGR